VGHPQEEEKKELTERRKEPKKVLIVRMIRFKKLAIGQPG